MRTTILLIVVLSLATSCARKQEPEAAPTEQKRVEGPMGLHVGDSVTAKVIVDSTASRRSWINWDAAVVKAVGKDWVDINGNRWHVDRLKEVSGLRVTCPHDQ